MGRDFDEGGDWDGPDTSGLWRYSVLRAVNSEKGQQNLRDLETALLEMKAAGNGRLIGSALVKDGEVCVNGALARKRLSAERLAEIDRGGIGVAERHTDWHALRDTAAVMKECGLQKTIACELAIANDEFADPRMGWQPKRDEHGNLIPDTYPRSGESFTRHIEADGTVLYVQAEQYVVQEPETPEARFDRMLAWVQARIIREEVVS